MEENNLRVRAGRIIYFILAIIFALCIMVQIYFAGVAIFLDGSAWSKHMMFVHLFGFNIPVLMLIFTFVGALPRWAYFQLSGAFISIFLMYFTANIKAILPWVGPLHVILAFLLFALSWSIVLKTWKLLFKRSESN
ncbi:DUF6220 domain-containing protein [Lederbergia panacisoli]|uniref:DUF6220 domain-containing protein n=1 Tax=Lederbergia panacisoli TaxID=1255251 RepID=UPI00214B06D4|nr:DUF6220 domain-containing protein [Lederbergia panacisoli]MCR2822294.1 DUF6220 domain-containing protein [Lederbergia panacisoli]